MRFAKLFFSVFVALVITGCAHPLVISPDLSKIERDSNTRAIPKNVGYYFLEDREKEVTTAGGGGDKVRYKPYKDIETGFYKMLSNVFKNVSALKTDKDLAISKNDINYIIALEVSTNSSSSSLLTWPPTMFGVNLSCNIKDATGKNIASLLVAGEGHAEYDEFKSDFSLAGKRASLDALTKMQLSFLNAPELSESFSKPETTQNQANQQNNSQFSHAASKQSEEEKLKELKRLYDSGLISNEVYSDQKKTIMGNP